MIKKLLLPLFAIFFSLTLFISCNDDDPVNPVPPEGLSVSSDSKTEGEDLVHRVSKEKSVDQETYSFSLTDNTTDRPADYNEPIFSAGVTLSGGEITIPTGVTSFTITVSAKHDLEAESDEIYDLSIEGVSATGTIFDHNVEVQNFIWQGMNLWYLWQESVPDLADNKFSTDEQYIEFINNTPEPEDFFESLLYDQLDHWSWIVDDYVALEQLFSGVSKSNGVEFGLVYKPNSNYEIFGYVKYILPDSDASAKSIKRGDLFTHVNGTQLTVSNYVDLLFGSSDTYTLSLVKYENNNFENTGVDIELTKFEYTENPVYITKVFEESGKKIGYLMYNGFTSNFDQKLNNAFLELKNEGITDLILDFRYNPGGSVKSAVYLASMVTGQFTGELFAKERWNSKLQDEFEANYPDWLVNNFTDKIEKSGEAINSLNLDKVHIIVTDRSASASELVINGLIPYINVKLIGNKTVGKYVGSVTLYDSENFGREGANPNHTYAMQPIVSEMVNKFGENDKDGFDPDILHREDYLADMGVLGEINEPLLQTTINDILGNAPKMIPGKRMDYDVISDSKLHTLLGDNMYVEPDMEKFKILFPDANE